MYMSRVDRGKKEDIEEKSTRDLRCLSGGEQWRRLRARDAPIYFDPIERHGEVPPQLFQCKAGSPYHIVRLIPRHRYHPKANRSTPRPTHPSQRSTSAPRTQAGKTIRARKHVCSQPESRTLARAREARLPH
ncbi:hypothetical protein K438DRAFT_1853530 [Mycena galopus ATCC 62051]|nr:hypothetical protein K438DRAFT_1870231 [Mycena galopus ATCC 62051]KAF8170626.1 hypothetical protein K438DRAFT_1853530 [Mycena galopus ATCC 62051]